MISTFPFIQYLEEHSELPSCNFKLFTTVTDVKKFSSVQDNSFAVQTVIMKNSITAAGKSQFG
ncbi:hypothetical protein [Candidatus Protochlamydia sp. R18]|uniref:hypothetical protein n=1 Tax=Candidatus Protochlamydia sp. R18 TaxID=1353977 RepID=UPI0005AB28BB|nr:hypothetical protein [Candidatus Protochlamydia sp. R18]